MAKRKVYAVRKGRNTGVFDTWEECKRAVHGFSGAVYKSFETRQEAQDYLDAGNVMPKASGQLSVGGKSSVPGREGALQTGQLFVEGLSSVAGHPDGKSKPPVPGREGAPQPGQIQENRLVAYVDGSFQKQAGRYSYGCILLTPQGEEIRESGSGNEPELLALRNVTGEMCGAMCAVKWAIAHGYPAVEICYDYAGIEQWATHGWQAKTQQTQEYAAFMDRCRGQIAILFTKIAAHTGNRYNEEADRLAKAALTDPANTIPEGSFFGCGD